MSSEMSPGQSDQKPIFSALPVPAADKPWRPLPSLSFTSSARLHDVLLHLPPRSHLFHPLAPPPPPPAASGHRPGLEAASLVASFSTWAPVPPSFMCCQEGFSSERTGGVFLRCLKAFNSFPSLHPHAPPSSPLPASRAAFHCSFSAVSLDAELRQPRQTPKSTFPTVN